MAGKADSTQRLSGKLLSGRYKVQDCLGEGAMGAVYRAEHTLMKKTVAIKVMRPQIGERGELVERFRREAQAAANIEHPNVCSASDFGEMDDGTLFLVIEYLEGHTLEDILAQSGRLSVERAVHIARQVCAALERAHELGIVHRDLKPENIMLVERDGDEDFAKILDFGVAHVRLTDEHKEDQLTRAGTVWGTPSYMSPEQATGADIDGRSDLYSLGVILYEMLAGKPPFADDSPARIMAMHLTEAPVPPRKVAPEANIPAGLERVVLQMLEKDCEDRPASAGALERLLAESGESGEPNGSERLAEISREFTGQGLAKLRQAVSSSAPAVERARTWFDAQTTLMQGIAAGVVAAAFFAVLAVPGYFLVNALSGPASDEVRQEAERNLAKERAAFLEQAGLSQVVEYLEGGQTSKALSALDELDEPTANHPHVAYLRGRVNAERGRWQSAVEQYAKAVDGERLYANDATLIDGVFERFGERSDERAAAARELIEAHLASHYATEKLAEAAKFGGHKAIRQRALQVLESTGRIGDLSTAQQLSIELRHASGCEQRKKLIADIKDEGDSDALEMLEYYSKRGKTGCGFLKMQDCYECIRSDLRDAIKDLKREAN